MKNLKIKFQIVPPVNNQANMDKQVIQAFKAQSIEGLCSIKLGFPYTVWTS